MTHAKRCASASLFTLLSLATLALPLLAADESEKPADAAKHLLKYKFQTGETLRWKVLHRATVKSTIQGTSQTAQTRTESIKLWHIDEATPDGKIRFTHSVDQVKMVNQISGRAQVSWDSTSDSPPPRGFQDAARAVGVPLTVVEMDQHGKVLVRKEKYHQPGAASDLPITIPLPDEAVAVGHVWSEPHEVSVEFRDGKKRVVKTRRRFELLSVKTGVARIEVDYQLLTPLRDKKAEAQLVQRLSSGEIRFDIDAGRVLSQQLAIDKRVHDFSGPGSLMHHLMRLDQELLKAEEVADKPAASATK